MYIEFIDFFVVFIEDGGARANLIFQAAATEGTAFPAPAVQAVAAVAIFFFINVTDDEPLSDRHKYLTYKNTKKGQKVRKIIALSALKNGYCRVQILSEAVFLK